MTAVIGLAGSSGRDRSMRRCFARGPTSLPPGWRSRSESIAGIPLHSGQAAWPPDFRTLGMRAWFLEKEGR